ncbi:MAG: hypothetical protein SOI56_04385 [Eubacteriales bacterium]
MHSYEIEVLNNTNNGKVLVVISLHRELTEDCIKKLQLMRLDDVKKIIHGMGGSVVTMIH